MTELANENEYALVNQRDEKSRRHPRWTRQENLTLIQAKEMAESSPHKGRKMSSVENSESKWVMISTFCKHQGVNRSPAQCRKRWSNLLADYKRIKVWESQQVQGDSFWTMRTDARKDNKLPISFDAQVFNVLEGRGASAVSPMPLQALSQSQSQHQEEEVADEVVWDIGDGHDSILVLDNDNKTSGIVNDTPVNIFYSPDFSVGIEDQHHRAFLGQNSNSKQDAVRKLWPGISDSPEKVKRRRISTDDQISNGLGGQILKALEANNKLLHAQLDSHNKNCELDRKQTKESIELLQAALGKLTDVVMKIAERQ